VQTDVNILQCTVQTDINILYKYMNVRETHCLEEGADRTGSGSGEILPFIISGPEPSCYSIALLISGFPSLAQTSQCTLLQ
jgi:hypothetical protein